MQVETDRITIVRRPLTRWEFVWRIIVSLPLILLSWSLLVLDIVGAISRPRKWNEGDLMQAGVIILASIGSVALIPLFRNRRRRPVRLSIDQTSLQLHQPGIWGEKERLISLGDIRAIHVGRIETSMGRLKIALRQRLSIRLLTGENLQELEFVAKTMNHAIKRWREI
ncbi:MAG TPA: hypothetical protein VHS31_09830 [Tepidisphaeraceae bacterium]|nr:hypothetical protein [Tepidisphaeraceae bacterium]